MRNLSIKSILSLCTLSACLMAHADESSRFCVTPDGGIQVEVKARLRQSNDRIKKHVYSVTLKGGSFQTPLVFSDVRNEISYLEASEPTFDGNGKLIPPSLTYEIYEGEHQPSKDDTQTSSTGFITLKIGLTPVNEENPDPNSKLTLGPGAFSLQRPLVSVFEHLNPSSRPLRVKLA